MIVHRSKIYFVSPNIDSDNAVDNWTNEGDETKVALIGEVTMSASKALLDKYWKKAMFEEYRLLVDMNTWKLVKLSI